MQAPNMVPLTTASSAMEARILAAHLGAEGVLWELRGNVDGPYPIGPVEVLVDADDLAAARQLLPPDDTAIDLGRTPRELWIVLVAILALSAFTLARMLAYAG